jgi:uncharacterized repeat protein (TIGR03803 family)
MGNRTWGTMVRLTFLISLVTAVASAQTLTTLLSFNGTNGSLPTTLVQGADGNYYGTTGGGANVTSICNIGCGTVFSITPAGELTNLHNFDLTDGANPSGGMILSADGNFYGTTSGGGPTICGRQGCGTIYKITPQGALTTLHGFNETDGASPASPPIQAANGLFYGTTIDGGSHYGIIYKYTPGGKFTKMRAFGIREGTSPSGLMQATNGTFYGTTVQGGSDDVGTVFSMTPQGTLTTIFSFGHHEGDYAGDALVQATDGYLYGTTGGGTANSGSVFKITTGGTLTTLYTFTNGDDGGGPNAGLIQATDGNFYGTTSRAGSGGHGTIFQITPAGVLTTLHSFSSSDGADPGGTLLQATDGNIYGTTYYGGASDNGTIFRLSMGLGPFVKTVSASGQVGDTVMILGTNLTGSTSVTFNGMAAEFTVVSATEITATVPTGATTGPVQVTTPSGTLSSNVVFQVE